MPIDPHPGICKNLPNLVGLGKAMTGHDRLFNQLWIKNYVEQGAVQYILDYTRLLLILPESERGRETCCG